MLYISVATELLFVLVRQEIFLTASTFSKSSDFWRIILYSERILISKEVLGSFSFGKNYNRGTK